MPAQLDLFRPARHPAKRNPRTMHVIDAGNVPGWGRNGGVRLQCEVCNHETGWVPARSVTAELNGRVCPKCKGVAPQSATDRRET